jgi:hypothetical protein
LHACLSEKIGPDRKGKLFTDICAIFWKIYSRDLDFILSMRLGGVTTMVLGILAAIDIAQLKS